MDPTPTEYPLAVRQAPASTAATRVLVGLIRVHHRDGRATTRTIGKEIGRNPATVYHHLLALADAGLVDWKHRAGGTIRPLVRPVPFGHTRFPDPFGDLPPLRDEVSSWSTN